MSFTSSFKPGFVALAAFVATFAFASSAGAQGKTTVTQTSDYREERVGGDQVVTFGVDELDAPPNGAYGNIIRRPPGILRVQLIRPRMNFVSELVKSVENL